MPRGRFDVHVYESSGERSHIYNNILLMNVSYHKYDMYLEWSNRDAKNNYCSA